MFVARFDQPYAVPSVSIIAHNYVLKIPIYVTCPSAYLLKIRLTIFGLSDVILESICVSSHAFETFSIFFSHTILWSNMYNGFSLYCLPARNTQYTPCYICSLRIYRHYTWRVWKRLVVSVRLCFPVMVVIVAFSWRHEHAHAHVLALWATFLHGIYDLRILR